MSGSTRTSDAQGASLVANDANSNASTGTSMEMVEIPVVPAGDAAASQPPDTTSPRYGAVPTTDSFVRLTEDGAIRNVGLSARTKLFAGIGVGAVAVIAIVTMAVLLSRKSGNPQPDSCSYSGYRLSGAAVPSSYNILWRPTFTAPFVFQGTSQIAVAITADGQACIQLHSYELDINNITVATASGTGAVPALSWSFDAVNERTIVRLPHTLNTGDAVTLTLDYSAPLRTDNNGLYQSNFTDDAGQVIPTVVTQFEATYFRRASPGFDEPGMKATFAITLDGIPDGYTALSNMPVGSSTRGPSGLWRYEFLPTPRMSTYLAAAVAAPMINSTHPNGGAYGNVTISVYAPALAENAYKIAYALDAGVRALAWYEQTLRVPFPLPKVDMVAVGSFAAGAMENWGLITYRETALLGNTSVSSTIELQRIAVVVCHGASARDTDKLILAHS